MKMVIALVLVMSSSFAQAKTINSMRVQKCVKKKGAKSVVCAFQAAPATAAPTEKCVFNHEQAATICTSVQPSTYVPYGGAPQASNCRMNYEQAATICEYPTHANKPRETSFTGLPLGSQPGSADGNCRKHWESGLTVCD